MNISLLYIIIAVQSISLSPCSIFYGKVCLMKRIICLIALVLCLSVNLKAEQTISKSDISSATKPLLNTAHWVPARNAHVKKSLLELPCDILFVGDSITEQWEIGPGKAQWNETWAPLNAVNFGVSGDRTEHVLWRCKDSKLATTTDPKICILNIGCNNLGTWKCQQSSADTLSGVKTIAETLLKRYPKTALIIMCTFPYNDNPEDSYRKKGEELNKGILSLKLPRTKILDITKDFLQDDGHFKKGLFVDKVHLSAEGYKVWAGALLPLIRPVLAK